MMGGGRKISKTFKLNNNINNIKNDFQHQWGYKNGLFNTIEENIMKCSTLLTHQKRTFFKITQKNNFGTNNYHKKSFPHQNSLFRLYFQHFNQTFKNILNISRLNNTFASSSSEKFEFPYKKTKFVSNLNPKIYKILKEKADYFLSLKAQLEQEESNLTIEERKNLLKTVSNASSYYSNFSSYENKLNELLEVHQLLINFEKTPISSKSSEEEEEIIHFESLEQEIAEQLTDIENNFLHQILANYFVNATSSSLQNNSNDTSLSEVKKFSEANRNAILEIRCGAGGGESSLFVSDILQMYQNYADLKGWKFDIMTQSTTEYGGLREVTASLSSFGEGVFERLKYESGVHRVQRIPETEAMGRIHTSTITVAVLPEAKDIDVDIRPSDIRVDVYRSSGAGGQHVNTTESAVRITHLRTGIVVAIQDERSQHSNRDKAMKILRSRILDLERQKEEAKRSKMRMQQVGTGMRNERIRTYNFPQSRITDHRCNHSEFGVDRMLLGELLDNFVDKLQEQTDNENLQMFLDAPDNYISF